MLLTASEGETASMPAASTPATSAKVARLESSPASRRENAQASASEAAAHPTPIAFARNGAASGPKSAISGAINSIRRKFV